MFQTPTFRRLGFALLASAALAACDDDPAAPEDEPEVQTVTLTVGTSTVTINKTNGTASGDLEVPAGASAVVVAWKKADGSAEDLVTSAEFEAKIVPTTPANLSWTASGAFGGTLTTTGLAVGATTTATIQLYHKEEQHPDFGPYNFTVKIKQ